MEQAMKRRELPGTDSIQELAKFWNTHDLTDFADQLKEVTTPVFVRSTPIQLKLPTDQAKLVREMAQAKGISQEELIRQWVSQKLARRNGRASNKPRAAPRRARPTKS
jgi:hypothetical protein